LKLAVLGVQVDAHLIEIFLATKKHKKHKEKSAKDYLS